MEFVLGVSPQQNIGSLKRLREDLSVVGQPSTESLINAINGYLQAVEKVETELKSILLHDRWIDHLYTSRYWHIRDMINDIDVPWESLQRKRPWELLSMEAEWQQMWLDNIISDLERYKSEYDQFDPDAVQAVLDTNVHLHYQPFNEIKWTQEFEWEKVCIILPIEVIRELDDKKYSTKDSLAKRAKSRLKLMCVAPRNLIHPICQ